jgi:hypothetical protein
VKSPAANLLSREVESWRSRRTPPHPFFPRATLAYRASASYRNREDYPDVMAERPGAVFDSAANAQSPALDQPATHAIFTRAERAAGAPARQSAGEERSNALSFRSDPRRKPPGDMMRRAFDREEEAIA